MVGVFFKHPCGCILWWVGPFRWFVERDTKCQPPILKAPSPPNVCAPNRRKSQFDIPGHGSQLKSAISRYGSPRIGGSACACAKLRCAWEMRNMGGLRNIGAWKTVHIWKKCGPGAKLDFCQKPLTSFPWNNRPDQYLVLIQMFNVTSEPGLASASRNDDAIDKPPRQQCLHRTCTWHSLTIFSTRASIRMLNTAIVARPIKLARFTAISMLGIPAAVIGQVDELEIDCMSCTVQVLPCDKDSPDLLGTPVSSIYLYSFGLFGGCWGSIFGISKGSQRPGYPLIRTMGCSCSYIYIMSACSATQPAKGVHVALICHGGNQKLQARNRFIEYA